MESSSAHTVESVLSADWRDNESSTGVIGRPRGTFLTYAASTVPEIGNCVMSMSRTLGGGVPAVESLEIRAFRAEVEHRTAAPTMPQERFLIHPAGLGLIRARLRSNGDITATVEQFSMAGNSAEQRRFHANIGIAHWLLTCLHQEIAAAGAAVIEVPARALSVGDDASANHTSLDEWSGTVFVASGYRIEANTESAHARLHPQYLPR